MPHTIEAPQILGIAAANTTATTATTAQQNIENLVLRQLDRERGGIDTADPPRTVTAATAAVIDPESANNRERLNRMHERVIMKRKEVDLLERLVGSLEKVTSIAEKQHQEQQEYNKRVLERLDDL